jgi:thiamine-phosphate pyrophosphorylase
MPEATHGPLLRILDANANRAREALRVIEDYARFALDDANLSEDLKGLRHELSAATKTLLPAAILHRDTPGDVGTTISAAPEMRRSDLAEIITAAGKRLGEALRSIEECLKVISPENAGAVETIRYRFYDIEQRVAITLRPTGRMQRVRLYVLISESLCRTPWLEAAQQAILGGADCLQLREKELDGGELLGRARQFVELCRKHNVISIINDRPDIALLSGADGVHVGQQDLPARDVRQLIGPDKLLGVSTHNLDQARAAVMNGADYIGIGPIFPSTTKPRDFLPGPEFARQVAESIRIPAIAIAGITVDNVDEVLESGIRAVAVGSGVLSAENARAAAAALKRQLTDDTIPLRK